MRVLFVGGDNRIVDLVTTGLRIRWPEALIGVAETALKGLESIELEQHDLVVLDQSFQDMSLAKAIQEARLFSAAPMLVLGRDDNKLDVLMSLELGADDFICLPCDLMEITARIGALIRRTRGTCFNMAAAPLVSGPLQIRPATFEAFLDGKTVQLTTTEFRLLYLLMRNHGAIVTHRTIGREIWSDEIDCSAVIKAFILRIRRKLGESGQNAQWIINAQGLGYRFAGPFPTAHAITPREVQISNTNPGEATELARLTR